MVADQPRPELRESEPRERKGFALFAAVIIIAVIAVMATVVAVTLSGDNDQARIESAADVLHRLVAAMDTPKAGGTSFGGKANLGVWPAQLSQLTHHISVNDQQCKTPSNQNYNSGQTNFWLGPYYLVPIPTAGYNVAPGFFANNQLVVNPSGHDLAIQMAGVSLRDAQGLELIVEKISTGAGPVVTFPLTDPTTVLYHLISARFLC